MSLKRYVPEGGKPTLKSMNEDNCTGLWQYEASSGFGGQRMKILGLAICLATIFGAAATVGIHLYVDILSFLFVLGGAVGFLVMKNNPRKHIENLGQGAVYFGWMGTLVGLIAITGNRFMVWGDIDKVGPALAVSMLTILYGYTIKLVTVALAKD